MSKPRRFTFHYNKPASQRAKRPQISVHIGDRCLIVDNVSVGVHTHGRINKRQPYFVMVGFGCVRVRENIAYLTKE
jgi:hypothetical protein